MGSTGEMMMHEGPRKPDKPEDPPFEGGEDETPKREDPREAVQDVKEPPLTESGGA
jgi:hypothetical protein